MDNSLQAIESSLRAAAAKYGRDYHRAYRTILSLKNDPLDPLLYEIADKIVNASNPGLAVLLIGDDNPRNREVYRREFLRGSPHLIRVPDAGDSYAFEGASPDFANDEAEVFRDASRRE
jgi:hypothetical protein